MIFVCWLSLPAGGARQVANEDRGMLGENTSHRVRYYWLSGSQKRRSLGSLESAFGHTGLAPYRDFLDLPGRASGCIMFSLVVIDENSTFHNTILWWFVICHSRGTSLQISRKWRGIYPWVFAICHTLCLKLKSSNRRALVFTRQIERQGKTYATVSISKEMTKKKKKETLLQIPI